MKCLKCTFIPCGPTKQTECIGSYTSDTIYPYKIISLRNTWRTAVYIDSTHRTIYSIIIVRVTCLSCKCRTSDYRCFASSTTDILAPMGPSIKRGCAIGYVSRESHLSASYLTVRCIPIISGHRLPNTFIEYF